MKKRRILCLLLAAVFIISMLPGCKGTDTTSKKASGDVKVNSQVNTEDTTDLTFIRPLYNADDTDDVSNYSVTLGIQKYEEKYGVNVSVIDGDFNTWQQKIFQNANSGTPIDVIYGDNAYYPYFAMVNYVEPMSDYVDLDADYISKTAMDTYFKYKDNYYCAAGATISPSVLFYNKDMLQEFGLQDPMDLYKAGNWNFDTFRDMCKAVTNADENRWGLANWYAWFFLGCNHTALCKLSDDGKYELNLDDPNVKYALEYTQDAYFGTNGGKPWRWVNGSDIFQSWYDGDNLFVNEYEWHEADTIMKAKDDDKFDFDYGVVGLPYGPNNTDHYNICNAGGYGVGTGSKTPYHDGVLIEMILEQEKELNDQKMQKVPQDHRDLYEELRQKPYNDTYYDSCLPSCGAQLFNLVCGGTNVSTAIQKVTNTFQNQVDFANDTDQ